MKTSDEDTLRPEYDLKSLGTGARGKYYECYQQGTNVVVIEPELSREFPNAKAVNDALREVLEGRKKAAT
jgi:hypothetical protein